MWREIDIGRKTKQINKSASWDKKKSHSKSNSSNSNNINIYTLKTPLQKENIRTDWAEGIAKTNWQAKPTTNANNKHKLRICAKRKYFQYFYADMLFFGLLSFLFAVAGLRSLRIAKVTDSESFFLFRPPILFYFIFAAQFLSAIARANIFCFRTLLQTNFLFVNFFFRFKLSFQCVYLTIYNYEQYWRKGISCVCV